MVVVGGKDRRRSGQGRVALEGGGGAASLSGARKFRVAGSNPIIWCRCLEICDKQHSYLFGKADDPIFLIN